MADESWGLNFVLENTSILQEELEESLALALKTEEWCRASGGSG